MVPGGSINLTFTFTPSQAGNFIRRFVSRRSHSGDYGDRSGAALSVFVHDRLPTNPISPNGSVFFAMAQLGQSSSTTFTVTNSGTAPGTISGIYIGQANSPFAITGLPQFPLTVARINP